MAEMSFHARLFSYFTILLLGGQQEQQFSNFNWQWLKVSQRHATGSAIEILISRITVSWPPGIAAVFA